MTHNQHHHGQRLSYGEASAMLGSIKSADLQDRLAEIESVPRSMLTPAERSEAKAVRAVLTYRSRHNCNPI